MINMTIDEVREKVREIVAGVKFGTLPAHKAVVDLMVMFRNVEIIEIIEDQKIEITQKGIAEIEK